MAEKKPIEGDDGRTVAPMNVEGMPWSRRDREKNAPAPVPPQQREKMSSEDRWAFFTGAFTACLLFTTVLFGAIAIVIGIILLFGH